MPIPTPFHPRTSELCTSLIWKDWAGYFSVGSYDTTHETEYFTLRHGAGLIDVSPLFKYRIRGIDATAFLRRVMARDIGKMRIGQVFYTCWCDDAGKVIDDGTVCRLDEQQYLITAAEPMFSWFVRFSRGFSVDIEDQTERYAMVALQGPTSREILRLLTRIDIDALRYFQITSTALGDLNVHVSRTGYTGDLGYEIWVEKEGALALWDVLMEAGRTYGIQAVGLDALDVARIEAAYIMNGVDFSCAHHCLIESRKNSPFELGLGWTVDLDREPFTGQQALQAEKERASKLLLAGLELDWLELEALYAAEGLPAQVPTKAWRAPVPVYDRLGRQIGRATSGAWSPILKKSLALALVESRYAVPGAKVRIEVTVEYRRRQVTATVVPTPFFNPARKKS